MNFLQGPRGAITCPRPAQKERFMPSDKPLLFSILTFLVFLSLPSTIEAKDRIAWLEAVAPPYFIHHGPLAGEGYGDLITDILTDNLSDYEHQRLEATISRHYRQWQQGEMACSLGMYKTPEREEMVYFSIPSVFTLPVVLVITKENFAKFGSKKMVSLRQLLQSKDFIIGRSQKRSLGNSVDELLDTYGNSDNIFNYEGSELANNLFKMLLAGRIDALPALPEEAIMLAETKGFRDRIMTIGIAENQQDKEASLSYVACSKTEWGKKTIARINEVLLELRPTRQYRGAYERWLDPSAIDAYRTKYQEVFLQIRE